MLAVGFDTAQADPTGTWSHRAADFELMGRIIGETGRPILAVQEGGYRVRTLGVNARHFFVGLSKGGARPLQAPKRRKSSEAPPPREIHWREAVRAHDVEAIRALVEETGYFNTAEAAMAAELVAERVQRGRASGYEFVVAEDNGRLAGFACFGPIAATDNRHDLYWIAVARAHQRSGLGRALLSRVEAAVMAQGGKRIYIETSSTETYSGTRRFYRAMTYQKIAEIPDFYRAGDAKVIFSKELAS